MQDIAILIQHIQFQILIRCRNYRKSCFRTAKNRTLYRRYLPAERTGRIDHIVDMAPFRFDVLEIMDVPADIQVDSILAQQRIDTLLHVFPLNIVL